MEINFAPLSMDHIDQIVAIEKKSYTTPWSREAFVQEAMDNDMACYLVALHEGKVVGYAGMWLIIDEGHITTIAVHPEYRRLKIGQNLLAGLVELCKIKGACRMTLEVRASNAPAQSLYKKFGFVPGGVRRGYYADNKEDAVIMWKEDV